MKLRNKLRALYFFIAKIGLKKNDFSIISNNCIAGCVLHDFNIRFDTPTINLFIPFPDYIKFLTKIRYYVNCDFIDRTNDSPYPIGLLGGEIAVHFLHYKTFDEGVKAWKRRAKRIHWDNLYIVLVEKDGCTEKDLETFDKLPFANKIALTHVKYKKLNNAHHIKGFEKENELGNIMQFNCLWRKHYDNFNWIRFINNKMK